MRVTIPHKKTQQQAKEAIDRGMGQLFNGMAAGPVEFADLRKEWQENTMTFSVTAKMGFVKAPIKGTLTAGEKEVIVDVDLGILGKLLPQDTARTGIETSIRGLLT